MIPPNSQNLELKMGKSLEEKRLQHTPWNDQLPIIQTSRASC